MKCRCASAIAPQALEPIDTPGGNGEPTHKEDLITADSFTLCLVLVHSLGVVLFHFKR